jgi:hypothetical protein
MAAWLQLLSVARTRVVDKLLHPEDDLALSNEPHTQAAVLDRLSAELLAVLDPVSIGHVVTERASEGRCGNPGCVSELAEGKVTAAMDGGGSDVDAEEAAEGTHRRRRMRQLGEIGGERGEDESSSSDESDVARERVGHRAGQVGVNKTTSPEGADEKRPSWLRGAFFCSKDCRTRMHAWSIRASGISDNDRGLVDAVLRLFPGLRSAMLAATQQQETSQKSSETSVSENPSRATALRADAAAQAQAVDALHLQLRLPTSSSRQSYRPQAYVGGAWMSVAGRALSLSFSRVSPATVRLFRRNAAKYLSDFSAALDSEVAKAREAEAAWASFVVAGPFTTLRTKLASLDLTGTDDANEQGEPVIAREQQPQPATTDVASPGTTNAAKLRLSERRRQFADLVTRELRRASLLLRVELSEDKQVQRVVHGVAQTFDVADLMAPAQASNTLGGGRRDPDPETCLLFLFGILGAASVTDRFVRAALLPALPALGETLEAMHVTPVQYARLVGEFYGN